MNTHAHTNSLTVTPKEKANVSGEYVMSLRDRVPGWEYGGSLV